MREVIERIEREAAGLGPGGRCKCPEFGHEADHTTGVPCNESKCPKCGAVMGRLAK